MQRKLTAGSCEPKKPKKPKKLTDASCKSRRPQAEPYWDAATTGLGLKVLARGKRVWVAQLKFPGFAYQSTRNIGVFPAMTLAEARVKAASWYAMCKAGIDPTAVEAEERAKADAARLAEAAKVQTTFAAVARRYADDRVGVFRRAEQDKREIERLLISAWGEKPIADIKPRDVRMLIDKIKVRAPYDARSAWTHLTQIFSTAVHEELIEASPAASLKRRLLFKNVKIEHRQRVLNDAEIFAFWRAVDRLPYPYGPAYKLLLLLGVRLNELVGAQWSELDPEIRRVLREGATQGKPVNWAAVDPAKKILIVPSERFKSDCEHLVPLSDDALRLIESLPHIGTTFLFTLSGTAPVWLGHKIKVKLDRAMLRTLRAMARKQGEDPDAVKLPRWTNHDLRRSFRTGLSALKIENHVAELCLGHGRKGLERIYDQHPFVPEMREAREAWAQRVRAIVEPAPVTPPSNVVTLRPTVAASAS